MVWPSLIAFRQKIGAGWVGLWIVCLMNTLFMVQPFSFRCGSPKDLSVFIGPKIFTQYALAVAPSVQELRTKSHIHGVFVHRLVFTVRYAHFHELLEKREYQDAASDLIAIFSENVAPTSWWAVVLCDSVPLLRYGMLSVFEVNLIVNASKSAPELLFSSSGASMLLQKLEEIFIRTSYGAGADYLSVLLRVIRGTGDREGLGRLKTVRWALAHYFARCSVLVDSSS